MHYTITITRWMLLRALVPSYRHACAEIGVSPVNPWALWFLVRAIAVTLFR